MILLSVLLSAQAQTDAPTCIGTADTIDCRAPDGSTYIERRIGPQIVRQGTDKDGQTWTEYVTPVFDGTRTTGSDTGGHSWSQLCTPRYGTTGTDRNGQAVFNPPPPARPPTRPGEAETNSCR